MGELRRRALTRVIRDAQGESTLAGARRTENDDETEPPCKRNQIAVESRPDKRSTSGANKKLLTFLDCGLYRPNELHHSVFSRMRSDASGMGAGGEDAKSTEH